MRAAPFSAAGSALHEDQPVTDRDPPVTAGETGLERAALVVALLFIAALPISIAVSQILLTLAIGLWLGILFVNRERPRVPRFFWPLLA